MIWTTWLLVLKVFLFVIWPLAIVMPVAITQSSNADGMAACVFFMLLPHLAYPWGWMGGRFLGIFDQDGCVSFTEFMTVGIASGLILPVVVVTPILLHVDLPKHAWNVLLACALMLVGTWFPLLVATFWAPVVVEHRQHHDKQTERAEHARQELGVCFLALVLTLSVPLCLFLPLYLDVPGLSEGSEATLMFLLLLCHVAAFFGLAAPRLGVWLHMGMDFGAELRLAEVTAKLLWGLLVLPIAILLPVYMTVDLADQASDVLLAFIIALPSFAVLDCLRVYYKSQPSKLKRLLAMWFFGIIVPLGILLPSWLAASPSPTGATVLACFMFTPPALVLCCIFWLTARKDPNLPYEPLTFVCVGPWWWHSLYITLCIAIPLAVLLPIYFHGKLASLPRVTVLAFTGILSGLLFVTFAVSVCRRNGGWHGKSRTVKTTPASEDEGFVISNQQLYRQGAEDNNAPATVFRKGGHQQTSSRHNHNPGKTAVHPVSRIANTGTDSGFQSTMNLDPSYFPGAAPDRIVAFPGGSLRSNGNGNFAHRVASSLQNLHSRALIPPRNDRMGNNTWEPVSVWGLDPESGQLVCSQHQAQLKIFEPDAPLATGQRHAVYLAHIQKDTTSYILKWCLAGLGASSKESMTHILQASLLADTCAQEFNKCLLEVEPQAPPVHFLAQQAVCLEVRVDVNLHRPVWGILEKDLSQTGNMVTYTSSEGRIAGLADVQVDDHNVMTEKLWTTYRDLAQAFSCFSYFSSQQAYVISAISGVATEYTSPEVHWGAGKDPFQDKANRGDAGITSFFRTHEHNQFCSGMLALLQELDAGYYDENGYYHDEHGGYYDDQGQYYNADGSPYIAVGDESVDLTTMATTAEAAATPRGQNHQSGPGDQEFPPPPPPPPDDEEEDENWADLPPPYPPSTPPEDD